MIRMKARDDARGQAFTLEGLVAGLLLLSAVLFAMQAVVVAPGIPGADVEPSIRQQTADTLEIAQREGALSEMVRFYNNDSEAETFAGATSPTIGYGSDVPDNRFGELVDAVFKDQGLVANVRLEYRSASGIGSDSARLIYRGSPPDAATVATATVTLYSNQTLTGPDGDDVTLAEAAEAGFYPIKDIDPDGPLHNVVHVRVIVW